MTCVSSRSRGVVTKTYTPPPRFPSRRYRRSVVRLDDDISDIWVDRLLADLAQGILLEKVKSRSRRLPRTFFLDTAKMIVYYEGSTKKKTSETTIQISKIREVREGEKDFSKKMKDLQKSRCFVIILGASNKIMYMLAPDQEMRDKWIRALRYAMQMEQLAEQRNETDRNIREAFNRADINGDGHLDFEEVMKLLKSLNTDIKKKYARQMFDNADKNRNVSKHTASVLDREEFVFFYHSLTRRVEMEEIFLRFSNAKGFMNIRDLLTFLRDGQKRVDANEDQCRDILDQYEPDGNCKKRDQLSLDGFRKFLTSDREQIFNPAHRVVYQDMGRPITDYFIASSHNTYLADDQLKGPSQVEMYITALKKGCRCLELDCWDGPENDPIIYHGYTLTSRILFRDVIKAINEYAFKISPYPVTLSIENHCSLQQQQVMANVMNLTFGEKIWRRDDDLIETPTPEKLKNKIIIKGKRLPKASENYDDVSDEDEAADMPDNASGISNNNKVKSKEGQHKIKLHPELSKITTMKSVAFKSVETAAQKDPAFTVISLGESKLEKLCQTSGQGVNRITHHRLIRAYPAGSRTDSSNYNPVPMWNHGCQVVALNYQTSGEAMQLNHGRFMDNGGVGYVLKPSILLSEEKFGVVNKTVPRSTNSMKTLKISIISGFQIPKPKDSKKGEIIDPFIKVEVYGDPSDQAEYKTKVIENNGFNPRWYETCSFKLRVPELALVRFTVKDEDRGKDDFIGYYCLPVSSIQEGFRHFPLYDKNGDLYRQSLIFTHITLTSA